jgi:hypothetical protein
MAVYGIHWETMQSKEDGEIELSCNWIHFFYGLFNDDISISECVASRYWMMVNNESERVCKEGVVAQSKAISLQFLVMIKDNHEGPQNSGGHVWDSNRIYIIILFIWLQLGFSPVAVVQQGHHRQVTHITRSNNTFNQNTIHKKQE